MRKVIETKNAPAAIGPYSQAVIVGNLIYCSGQIGKDPATNNFAVGGIEAQTKQVMENLKAILAASGADLSRVVKTTIFLKNMADYPKVNEIYASYFQKPFPARATIGVASLPTDALVEIECVAVLKNEA